MHEKDALYSQEIQQQCPVSQEECRAESPSPIYCEISF